MATNPFTGGGGALPKPEIPPPNYIQQERERLRAQAEDSWLVQQLVIIGNFVVAKLEGLLDLMANFATITLTVLVQILDKAEGQEDPYFQQYLAALLTDLFDVPVNTTMLLRRAGDRGRLGAFNELGRQFYDVLVGQLVSPEARGGAGIGAIAGSGAPGAPGTQRLSSAQGRIAAQRWLGFVMNFAGKSGLVKTITSLFSLGLLDQVGEVPDEFSRNLGIGRLTRVAITPVLQTLIAHPLRWQLAEEFRPENLADGTALNLWAKGYIDRDLLYRTLAQSGYADSLISTMAASQHSEMGLVDLERMVRWKKLSPADALTRLRRKGYLAVEGQLSLEEIELARQDSRISSYIATVADLYADKKVDDAFIRRELATLPISTEEQFWIRKTAGLKAEFVERRLSLAQMENAVQEGIVDFFEFTEFLRDQHFPVRDQQIITAALRLKMNEEAAKERAAQEREAAARARAEQEAREKAARIAGTLPGAAPRRLTLAQMRAAAMDGIITDQEYADFLSAEGYGARDREILLADLAADREAAEAERARAEALRRAAPARRLSVSEMESAYVSGLVERAEYSVFLQEEGFGPRDIGLLLAAADAEIAARAAALAEAAARRAVAAPPRLSLEQETAAYLAADITRERYQQFLRDEGFSAEEAALIFADAERRRRAAESEQAAAERARQAAGARRIALADVEAAYVAGGIERAELLAYLVDQAFPARDREILLAAADRARAAREARDADQAARAALPAPPRLTEEQETAAYVAGVIDRARYELFLRDEGHDAEGIRILFAAAESRRLAQQDEKEEAARVKAAAPKARLTLAQQTAAFVEGLISESQLTLWLQHAGYEPADALILLAIARRDRAAYLLAAARDAARGAPPARKLLPRGDAERAFAVGDIDAAGLRGVYTAEGYRDPELQVLLSLALRRRRDEEEAEAAAAAGRAAPPRPKLTLSQMESAFIEGLVTLHDYVVFLEQLGYSPHEVEILTEALEIREASRGR